MILKYDNFGRAIEIFVGSKSSPSYFRLLLFLNLFFKTGKKWIKFKYILIGNESDKFLNIYKVINELIELI